MSSNFPAGFDSIAADKSNSTVALNDHSSHHNDLADAVNAIQTSLGVNLANVIGLPQQSQSANYTLTLADAGKSVVHPITDNNARTFTIPPNFSVAYPVGTQITFVNMANTLTVELANDLMYLAAFSTYAPASVQIAAYGVATALKITNTSWIISGQNVTADASLSYNFLAASSLPSSITFTRASTATFFNSSGTLTTAAIDAPRFDFNPATLAARGLLIEESRTNFIRNNTMQGAVAGTPGTSPTNWAVTNPADNITPQIVGVGTSNGITYIDIKYTGTSGVAGTTTLIQFESNTQVAASNGQTWTTSAYVAVVGGSTANISSLVLRTRFNNAAGSSVTTGGDISLTTATSTLSRFVITGTATDTLTAFVNSTIVANFIDSSAIDITLRIGLPQLELGAFATSVIPTTTTALTRSADVASVNTLSPWYNATEGTLYVQAQDMSDAAHASVQPRAASLNDGTTSNRIDISRLPASAQARASVFAGGASQFNSLNTAWPLSTQAKIALAYKAADFAACLGGGTVASVASGTVPTVSALTIGNVTTGGSSVWVGWIQRLTYYPRRLSNAELVSITT